jgi:hypothetical protein
MMIWYDVAQDDLGFALYDDLRHDDLRMALSFLQYQWAQYDLGMMIQVTTQHSDFEPL